MADVLGPVRHRHLIFTSQEVLGGQFQRERRLLSIRTRSGYDRRTWAAGFQDRRALPGMVISIQAFGALANGHPHRHALVTNGAMTRDGQFRDLSQWTPQVTGRRPPCPATT